MGSIPAYTLPDAAGNRSYRTMPGGYEAREEQLAGQFRPKPLAETLAGLVRRAQARSAVAAGPGPLSGLVVGNHVAADPRGGGGGPLPAISATVSEYRETRQITRIFCAGCVERTRLLPPGAHAARRG